MKKNNIAASFKSKYFRIGGYSTLISAAILVIVVIINLFAAALPSAYTKIDTSGNSIYTISDETRNIVSAISEDITVYFIAEAESEDTTIDELLGRYVSINNRITVKKINPATNPNFTAKYTDKTLSPSSLIFESARRSYVVNKAEIYVTEYSEEELMNYYTTGATPTGTTSFAGESKITGALDYVTSERIPTAYMLGGHGESPFGATMSGYITNDNIIVSDLSLLTSETVPEDASCLIINNPTADISADEIVKIKNYLNGGGYMIIMTTYSDTPMPNLYAFTAEYGAQYNNGMVIEGNANYYMSGYPYFLLPKIETGDISAFITNSNIKVAMPYSHSILKSETLPENITVTPLLTTSAAAYSKADAYNIESLEKADGDPAGPFNLGVLIKDSATGAKIIWLSSPYIADEQIDTYVSGGNSTFFLSVLTYLSEKESSVSIAAKSMQIAALVVSELSANMWGAVITILLPAGTVILGLCLWLRRRKR